jgi:hypothetical protein
MFFEKIKKITSICVTFRHVKVKEPTPPPHPPLAKMDQSMIRKEVKVKWDLDILCHVALEPSAGILSWRKKTRIHEFPVPVPTADPKAERE